MNSTDNFSTGPLSENRTEQATDFYFTVVLSLQVITSAIGFLVNTILLYGQAKAGNWPFNQRLLFLNVTAGAAVSTTIHACLGSYQLYQHIKNIRGDLADISRIDFIADSAQTSTRVSMVVLAFQNLFALRQCSRELCSAKVVGDKKFKRILVISIAIACVWTSAVGLVMLGLNPQALVYASEATSDLVACVNFATSILIGIIVVGAIYATSRTLSRLQIDFSIRSAQQNLAVRVHIKETISLNGAISPVLIVHLTILMTSLAIAFGLNRFLRFDSIESREASGNNLHEIRLATCTSAVDSVVLSFDAVYPFILWWKQAQLRKRTILIKCNRRRSKNKVETEKAPTIEIRTSNATRAAQTHHGAIEDHWNKVAEVKFSKSSLKIKGQLTSALR